MSSRVDATIHSKNMLWGTLGEQLTDKPEAEAKPEKVNVPLYVLR